MSKIIAMIFAILAGASTTLEAFINGQLEENTTALVATFISLVVGAIFFLISILVAGDFKHISNIGNINPKLFLGGIFGGLIIYFTIKSIGVLGISNTLILVVVSQILLGFYIDSVILGKITMHLYKYIGIVLLLIGTFFIMN